MKNIKFLIFFILVETYIHTIDVMYLLNDVNERLENYL